VVLFYLWHFYAYLLFIGCVLTQFDERISPHCQPCKTFVENYAPCAGFDFAAAKGSVGGCFSLEIVTLETGQDGTVCLRTPP